MPPSAKNDYPIATYGGRPNRWVRLVLLFMAVGLMGVFYLALRIHPYDDQGQPRRQETHTQLGLPPCRFYEIFQKPCPSCGMTTSFSLLVHGDFVNSLRANFAGTALALLWLALIPWSLWVTIRGRYLWVRSLEGPLLYGVSGVALLMLFRWLGVLLLYR